MRRRTLWISLMVGLVSTAGCAAVQPWERADLSDPIMIFDENAIEKGHLQRHHEYREGSSGATGTQGGGCGCG